MTPRAAEQFAAAMVAGSTGAGDPGADFPQLVTELEAAERAAGDGPDAVLLQTVRNKLDHLRPGGSAVPVSWSGLSPGAPRRPRRPRQSHAGRVSVEAFAVYRGVKRRDPFIAFRAVKKDGTAYHVVRFRDLDQAERFVDGLDGRGEGATHATRDAAVLDAIGRVDE